MFPGRVLPSRAMCWRLGRVATIDALERSYALGRWSRGWVAGLGGRVWTRGGERAVDAFEAFCERCDASELERGRRMLRVTRSMASGEGLGRRAEEEPRRREEVPEERDEARRDERGDDGIDFYTILDASVLCLD